MIGDAFSQYVISLAKNLKAHDKTLVLDIINTRKVPKDADCSATLGYDCLYNLRIPLGIVDYIPKVRGAINKLLYKYKMYKLKEIKKYDVILVNALWKENCLILDKVKSNAEFIVCALWGSDFYSRGENESFVFSTLDLCDRIIISTDQMVTDVQAVKKINPEKIRYCFFGLRPLQLLFDLQHIGKGDAKKLMGIEDSDIVVTCGYNSSPLQQHFKIIQQLTEKKSSFPSNFLFVFPLTYGSSPIYVRSIRHSLEKSGLRYKIFDTYLQDEQVAYLRKSTDIFIQIQTEDGLSGATREHLFCKNIVITGNWLPYGIFRSLQLYYEEVAIDDNIADKLLEVNDSYTDLLMKVDEHNTSEKFKPWLWTQSVQCWYKTVCGQ